VSAIGEGAILVRSSGGGWTAPEVTAYDNEAHLQRLITEQPGWIPGVGDDAFAVEELPTTGGSIDVCVVGRDGSITVVECKLGSNRERRRTVLGQVIDYASAIWSERPDAFLRAWQARNGQDLREVLEDASIEALERNITDARIDLCLAVDAIDDELRRLVEFLNRATRPDVRVTALQLAYARQGAVEILIPSTFGGELADAKVRDSDRGSERWTRETFADALATDDDRARAGRILELVEGVGPPRGTRPVLWFGQRPGGGVYLHPYGLDVPPAWLSVNSRGQLMICGTWKTFPAVAHHDAYAELAAALGQSHLEGARGVPVSTLDLERLWAILIDCAVAVNEAASGAARRSVR